MKVVPVYSSNFRDVQATLKLFMEEAEAKGIDNVVLISVHDAHVDVRGVGMIDNVYNALAWVKLAERHLMALLEESIK